MVETHSLLESIKADIRSHQLLARDGFLSLSTNLLETQPASGKWSAAECFEHMILAGTHYTNEIVSSIKKQEHRPGKNSQIFRSGFIGRRFVRSMGPRETYGFSLPIKTFKSLVPTVSIGSSHQVIQCFVDQQEVLYEQACLALWADLNRTNIPTLIGPILKLNLGDAFCLINEHNKRHLSQAQKALEAVKAIQ